MAGKAIVRPVFRSTDDRIAPGVWDPRLLFVKGEQGVLYDPSDLSTLFQDAAGTIPVTADSDPVGRVEDKSGNGNHATQSVAAARPVYQRGDSRGVVNLLKWSEAFDDEVWAKFASVDVETNVATDPNGDMTASRVIGLDTADGDAGLTQLLKSAKPSSDYAGTIYVKGEAVNIGKNIRLRLKRNGGSLVASNTDVTLTSDWQRVGVNITLLPDNTGVFLTVTKDTGVVAANQADSVLVAWAQLEQASTATEYQHNDSHLGGVGTGSADDLHWLAFDGVDDRMFGVPSQNVNVPFILSASHEQETNAGSDLGKYRLITRNSGGSSRGSIGVDAGKSIVISDMGSASSGGVVTVNVPHVTAAEFTVLSSDLYLDGEFITSGTPATLSASSPLCFGGQGEPTELRGFNGKVFGFIVVSNYAENNRVNIESYLAKKSGAAL